MKNRRKIIYALFGFIPFLLFSQSPSVSAATLSNEASNTKMVYASETDHLLAVWDDYLNVLNESYTAANWAFQYIDTFLETNNWQDLSEARTACLLAGSYTRDLTMTTTALSDEEIAALTADGVDTAFLSGEFDGLSDMINNSYLLLRYDCFYELEEEYDLKLTRKHLTKLLDNERQIASSWCDYEVYTTNYLALQLMDSQVVPAYMDELADKYPVIFQNYETYMAEEEEALNAGNECMDHIANDLEAEHSQNNAEHELELDQYYDTLDNEDRDAISEMIEKPQDAPALLPYPYNFLSNDAGYVPYTIDEEGNLQYLEYPMDLEGIAISQYLQVADYSAEDLEEYLEILNYYGVDVSPIDGTENYLVTTEDYVLGLQLNEENTLILNFHPADVTFTDQEEWIAE